MTERNRWPGGARLALSLVVNVEEGSEMSIAEGDRGPEVVDELGVALKKAMRNYGNASPAKRCYEITVTLVFFGAACPAIGRAICPAENRKLAAIILNHVHILND